MKRNDVELYYVSKQIKRLQNEVRNNSLTLTTLLVGFVGNIITLVLTLLNGKICDIAFIVVNSICIALLLTVIIVFTVKTIKNKNKPTVDMNCYDWCTKFDEYIVPNAKCAIENCDIVVDLEKQGKSNDTQYKLYLSEMGYHLGCSAKELKGMLRLCPEIIDKWVSKERIQIVYNLLEEMSGKLDENQYSSFFKDLRFCKAAILNNSKSKETED